MGVLLRRSDQEKKDTLFNWTVFVIYLALQIYLLLHHEPWRDESQAWIIARNASFKELRPMLSSEGHPSLWFLILKLCIAAGVSFYHCGFISLTFTAAAAALFLLKAPFRRLTKICILLSPIFFYYNSVFCRVYAVVLLLIVLLCICWPHRREKPVAYGLIAALLLQSHIMVSGIGIGCLIEMLVCGRKHFGKKHLAGAGITLASLICMILELRQTKRAETFSHVNLPRLLKRLTIGDISDSINVMATTHNYESFPAGMIALVIALILMVSFIIRWLRYKDFRSAVTGIGIVALCGTAFYWGIETLVRNAYHMHMASLFWEILLFLVWGLTAADCTSLFRQTERSRFLSAALSYETAFMLICLLMIPKSAWIDPVYDVKRPYSESLYIARQVEEHVPDGSVVAIQNHYLSTSLAAFLYDSEKELLVWDISNGCEFHLHKWGRKNTREITKETLYGYLSEDLGDYDSVYYIDGQKNRKETTDIHEKLVLLAADGMRNPTNEYYRLYRVDK